MTHAFSRLALALPRPPPSRFPPRAQVLEPPPKELDGVGITEHLEATLPWTSRSWTRAGAPYASGTTSAARTASGR